MSEGPTTPATPADDATDAAAPATAPTIERIRAIGCTTGTEERLLATLGASLDEPAQVVVVSTRASLRDLPDEDGLPVVALVHPGGAAAAQRFLEAGVAACVPEGREDLVAAVVGPAIEAPLTAPLRALLDAPPPPDELPATVQQALAEAGDAPTRRVAVVALPGLDDSETALGPHVSTLLRGRVERILTGCGHEVVCTPLTGDRYLLVFPDVDATMLPVLATRMSAAAGLFSLGGDAGQALHLGHAGVEDSSDARIQLDLAHAAADLAVTEDRSSCSVADVLERRSLPQAAEVLLELADAADRLRPDAAPSHLVAEVAAGLSTALGQDPHDVDVARLAGRLHAVGLIGAGDEADTSRRAELVRTRLIGLDPRVAAAIHAQSTPPAAPDDDTAQILAVALATADALHRGTPITDALTPTTDIAPLDPTILALAITHYAVPEPSPALAR